MVLASIARVHIVAIAALGTLTFGFAFTGDRPWLLAAVAAVDWFVVNLLNRVVDLKEDNANRIAGTDVVARHRRAVLVVGFGALAASFVATAIVLPALLPWRAAFHALGFAYNWPLLPGGRRIKQLYFWKNTASATGFLITVFAYPLVTATTLRADVGAATVLAAGLFFFLLELSYEVLYDLRDVDGDRIADVRTYPVVHGDAGGRAVAYALAGASFVVVVAAYVAGALPWRVAIMGAAPLLQIALARRALARGITSADCIRITWVGAALLAVWHVWIALGLPGGDL